MSARIEVPVQPSKQCRRFPPSALFSATPRGAILVNAAAVFSARNAFGFVRPHGFAPPFPTNLVPTLPARSERRPALSGDDGLCPGLVSHTCQDPSHVGQALRHPGHRVVPVDFIL